MNMYDTDEAMKQIWFHLATDFRTLLRSETYARDKENLLRKGVREYRLSGYPGRMGASPLLHKCEYQLESLFKRYRFKNDLYSDSQLIDMSWDKFCSTQTRLAAGITETPLINKVVREARQVAKKILGDYCPNEHENLCAFGKRACVGTGYADSNLHIKLSRPLTGSIQHIRWFKQVLKKDDLLHDAIKEAQQRKRVSYRVCGSLKMTLVPKSFKALRSIMPDTLIGSFYTRGMGEVLALRLKRVGLNIKYLQEIHGRKALESSKSRKFVTADLSAASDSISLWLLRRILPATWYRAIVFGRIPIITFGNANVRMETILTMGLGHTFPLQTLIFYSLLEGIRRVCGISARCSVYGDDLIYPRAMHNLVRYVFPRIQLLINTDKTYAQVPFRESCGSDYYRGVDVRPFNPEGEHQRVHGLHYGQFLYKLYNGLRRRWAYESIPRTLNYLYALIIHACGECFVVPPHFPDNSGVKFEVMVPLRYTDLRYNPKLQSCTFDYLQVTTGRRRVESQTCYYWEWLRQKSAGDTLSPYTEISDVPSLFWARRVRYRRGVRVELLIPFTVDKRTTVIQKSSSNDDLFYAGPPLRI